MQSTHTTHRSSTRARTWRALGALALFTGLLGVQLTGGCRSESSSGGFCSSLCATQDACSTSGSGGGTLAPLFCSTSGQSASCEADCESALENLGQAQDDFVKCAQCVLDSTSDARCDSDKASSEAQVACSDDCQDTSSSASDQFFGDFNGALSSSSTTSCNLTGEKDWNANDPLIQHAGGSASGTGWTCNQNCCETTGHWIYGPGVSLPPGTYEAGVRGLTISPAGKIGLDVVYEGADNENRYVDLQAGSSPITGSTTFTLTETATGVQVRLFCPQQAKVDSVYIKRM